MPFFGRSPAAASPGPPPEDRDLTTPEEAGQRQRRRAAVVWSVAAAVVIALVVLVARPAVRGIKTWQARRAAAEGVRLIATGDGSAAFAKLQDALSLRGTDPEVQRTAAVLLTLAEHGREAIGFWKEIEKNRALSREEQRDYALDLLQTGDAVSAAERLRLAWPNGTGGTSADWYLKMQIALRLRNTPEALALGKRLLETGAAGVTERQRLAAALILLGTKDAEGRRAGEAGLRRLADGDKSPVSLEAALLLLKQATQQVTVSRDRRQPVPDAELQDVLKMAGRVEGHPRAKVLQRLVAAQSRAVAQPENREKLVQQAIERYGSSKDDEEVATLGGWLYAQGDYRRLLETVTPERAIHSRTLYLLYLDGLGATGRWAEIRHSIEGQRFTLDPMVEQMYLARCAKQVHQPEGAGVHLDAALQAAGASPDKLLNLGRYAQADGALATAETAFRAAVQAAPESRPAREALLGLLEGQGRTLDARTAIKAMLAVWPQDEAVRNDDAYLGALLGEDLPAAGQTARELMRADPTSLPHRVTLALVELRRGHDLTAWETLHDVPLESFAVQGRYQAVYAAILWAAGYPADARQLAAQISRERLLPEERQLLEPIKDPA